jgi:dihydrofolate reductase
MCQVIIDRSARGGKILDLVRELVYSMMVSLDGFIEDSNGTLDWVLIDEEIHTFANDEARDAGVFLYGRRLYENMAAYWPTADADPAIPRYMLDFAKIWKAKPKVVFSKTLASVEWNSRLAGGDVRDEVMKLKGETGGELSVGGADLAASCIELGLVDEYRLIVQPVVLGGGKPFFPVAQNPIKLRLVETRTFASGVVFLRYRPASG